MTSTRSLPPAPRVTVKVTREAIDRATRKDSTGCMVVESIPGSFPNAVRVTVDAATIRFSDREKGLRYTYLTPAHVRNAIVSWDLGIKPEPFTFQLRNGRTTRIRPRDPVTGSRRRSPATPGQEKGLATAGLVFRKESKYPVPVGGSPPPMGALAGGAGVAKSKRRTLGMRSLAAAIEEAQRIEASQ